MSMNHYANSELIPDTLWLSPQPHHQYPSNMEPNSNIPQPSLYPNHTPPFFPSQHPHLSFNLNHDEEDEEERDHLEGGGVLVLEKEPMFEKPLTPSDVGKLNRLVIPKQHAEKYFPLGGGDSADKGLLLSFEDESGKCWRFRYSYWNSSQSYVLTKGWSRYVKEKQLDAGDVVLFQRHRTDMERLFIGWRKKGEMSMIMSSGGGVQGSNCGSWSRGLYASASSTTTSSSSGQQQHITSYPPTTMQHPHGVPNVNVPYHPDCFHAASFSAQNQGMMPLMNSKRVRLFGVNLECQLDEPEPSTPDDVSSSLPSQRGPSPSAYHQLFFSNSPYSSNTHNPMDITFSQDVNQMRNRRG